MTTTTKIVLMAAAMLAAASETQAQVPPAPASLGFVNVNIGLQPKQRFVEISNSFPIYGETATLATSQTIGSGSVFDISAGYRVREQLAVGVGFSNFSNTSGSAGVVSIPDPLVFGRPRSVTVNLDDLRHTERAVHLLAVYFFPITNELDVSVSAGPSFFRVKQELVSSVTVPAGRNDTATPVVSSESKSAVGGTFGIDGTYLVTRNFGAGGFIRYAGAKVDLPSVPGMGVGGFQAGVGARVRF